MDMVAFRAARLDGAPDLLERSSDELVRSVLRFSVAQLGYRTRKLSEFSVAGK